MSKILSWLGAVGLALAVLIMPMEWADARGGGGRGASRGGSGMGGGRSRRGNRGKTAKRDAERATRENRDAFKRDAASDAE